MKISELEAREIDKKILTICIEPRKIAEIAAKMNYNYDYVSKQLRVLTARGWLTRQVSLTHEVTYILNTSEVQA